MNSPDQAPYLDERQAGALLQMAPITLRKWRAIGSGPPYVKMGHAVRYSRAALEAWIASQTVTPSRAGGAR